MSTQHKECAQAKEAHLPFAGLPRLKIPPETAKYPPPPTESECMALWQKYKMLDNIRRHSLLVAKIATQLATRTQELGMEIDISACRAAGLLHDIAKTWCIEHGGSHAVIGGSWTVQETRHYGVAQGVILHVHWPWKLPEGAAICCLPIFIIYADKRVRHDRCVSLQDRFDDLIARYGISAAARASIRNSCAQAQQIETALSRQLKWNLNEDSFDSGRLVD